MTKPSPEFENCLELRYQVFKQATNLRSRTILDFRCADMRKLPLETRLDSALNPSSISRVTEFRQDYINLELQFPSIEDSDTLRRLVYRRSWFTCTTEFRAFPDYLAYSAFPLSLYSRAFRISLPTSCLSMVIKILISRMNQAEAAKSEVPETSDHKDNHEFDSASPDCLKYPQKRGNHTQTILAQDSVRKRGRKNMGSDSHLRTIEKTALDIPNVAIESEGDRVDPGRAEAKSVWMDNQLHLFEEYRDSILARQQSHFYSQHREDSHSFEIIRALALTPLANVPRKCAAVQRYTSHEKFLVFDLDNTLVLNTPDISAAEFAIGLPLMNGNTMQMGISMRPYARECLELASKLFEVVIFTASHQSYAEEIRTLLDPQHTIVHHVLSRQHCLFYRSAYFIKDLRVLQGLDLKDVAIVENAVMSYGLQLYNGIPVPTWTGDVEDRELLTLMKYLPTLAHCEDVRLLNETVFADYYKFVQEFKEPELCPGIVAQPTTE